MSVIYAASNATPPPTAPPMKIMRRSSPSREGSAVGSGGLSKATSEAGESGNDGDRAGSSTDVTPAKDRMILSREEKEVKYQKARERIFRDFPESKSSDSTSGENNISRSSSASGRKKTYRQKTPHDDSFEVRSQYNVYYPGVHHYTNGPVPYNLSTNDGSFPNQPSYVVGPGMSPASMTYVQSNPNNPMYSGPVNMNAVPQYPAAVSPQTTPNSPWQGGNMPQQSPFAGYTSMNQPSMMGQQSNKSSPALNNYAVPNSAPYQHVPPNWTSHPYQGNFQQSSYRNQPAHWPTYPPQSIASSPTSYPYGQFPGQHIKPGMQNHSGSHPLPGSFNRSLFNPQTRSFVPSGRHPAKNNQYGMNSYMGGQNSMQPPQWSQFPETNSRNFEPSALPGYNTSRVPSTGNRDSIAKWGTPSHLPPKPPPSEVSSDFDLKHRGTTGHPYAANTVPNPNNGPLVVSGETGSSKPN